MLIINDQKYSSHRDKSLERFSNSDSPMLSSATLCARFNYAIGFEFALKFVS
jgi:hypothetical protein